MQLPKPRPQTPADSKNEYTSRRLHTVLHTVPKLIWTVRMQLGGQVHFSDNIELDQRFLVHTTCYYDTTAPIDAERPALLAARGGGDQSFRLPCNCRGDWMTDACA